jgi:hypothetical protein
MKTRQKAAQQTAQQTRATEGMTVARVRNSATGRNTSATNH